MLPLARTLPPASAPELRDALEEGLRRLFSRDGDLVSVTGGTFPGLETLSLNLDGAQLRPDVPRPPALQPGGPTISVRAFLLHGRPLQVQGAPIDLRLEAQDVVFRCAADRAGQLFLQLERASQGELAAAVAVGDLERLIFERARHEASRHGVTIESVALSLQSSGPRALEIAAEVKARKMFLSARLRLLGSVSVDQDLNAHVRGLRCEGTGAIAALACSVLDPHLQRVNGRAFSLLALPLGDIRLRDISLALDDRIEVRALFSA